MICNNCPRKCGIDRENNIGICGVGVNPKVAKAYLHKWEEPCISYKNGSGTVFFSGCNLKCVYCQNYKISSESFGKEITTRELADIFRKLEELGADNINLVSPSHYVKAIVDAFKIYKPSIPIVYNSSGYDSIECLELIKDYIDIYLVDFKYFSNELALKYSKAKDYHEIAKGVILKMKEYQPKNIYEGDKLIKGVIIRHLILPGQTNDSIEILKWIKDNVSSPTISLMGQYTPMYLAPDYPEINRKLKPIEYKRVASIMVKLGLTDGYLQELSSAEESYTPVWDLQGIEL